MKRTRFSNNERQQEFTHDQIIQTMSTLVNRAALAYRMGTQTYSGDRNINEALGYPLNLTYKDYYSRYSRQDLAKAIIDRPVRATWHGPIEVLESNDDKETQLEKEWANLFKDETLNIRSILSRVDKLASLGKYAALLIGLDDTKANTDFIEPVKTGKRQLKYLKAFSEDNLDIAQLETDPMNPRYGLPLVYQVTIEDVAASTTMTLMVHYSRIVHIAYDKLDSEIEGTPQLEVLFNRLLDIEKLVGGDAEMFWRGARPGYHGKVDPDYQLTPKAKADFKDQLDEYEHNLRRFLIMNGIDIQTLAQQISDPKNHVDVQIQMISAVTGIPKRILTGSERGELSSTQDQDEWNAYVGSRRENYIEPNILRPLISALIKFQILPKPKDDFTIQWSDLFAKSDKDKAEIGKTRAEALNKYMNAPGAEGVIPPDSFLEFFMGLSSEQIELIKQQRDAAQVEEQNSISEPVPGDNPQPDPNNPNNPPQPMGQPNNQPQPANMN